MVSIKNSKNSAVKVNWLKKNEEWQAELLLVSKEGFYTRGLQTGRKISFEVNKQRRCTGYSHARGERAPCPDFAKITSGDQCPACRGKDIYTDYVRGSENGLDGEFSVYIAQISDNVKVGVARSSRLEKRWIEQGADYAAEVFTGLSSNKALEKEDELTSKDLRQFVMKKDKVSSVKEQRISSILEEKDLEGDVINVQELTQYPRIQGRFRNKGLIQGEVQSVKGQIVSNGRICIPLNAGKVLRRPVQKGVTDF